MAIYANIPYCISHNEIGRVVEEKNVYADLRGSLFDDREIIAYFRGPILSKNQWQNRAVSLASLDWDKLTLENTLVDSIWLQHVQKMIPFFMNKLKRVIKKFKDERFSIVFVGHGIGGAYAVLVALHIYYIIIHQKIPEIPPSNIFSLAIVTFGTPRIGNVQFAKLVNKIYMKKNVFRVTHSNDWITRAAMPKGLFLHHEPEYWLGKSDCDCPEYSSNLEWLHICLIGKDSKIDENPECNLGTIDSEIQSKIDPNMGPYLGVIYGNCAKMNPNLLKDE
ncbi:hypothetical protein G9A89_001132 [Geosiphon pyriformis]|nr:hypothetical protein G9A89_001132 [Geosiphon pyriformis]